MSIEIIQGRNAIRLKLDFIFNMGLKVKLSPSEGQEKWGRRLKASQSDILAGVEKVTIAPTKQAVEKIEKMQTKLMEAFADGRVKRGLERVSLEDWKNAMKSKLPARLAGGVDGAKDKQTDFFTKLFAHQNAKLGAIHAMPDLTKSDTKNRMTKWFDDMSGFKYK